MRMLRRSMGQALTKVMRRVIVRKRKNVSHVRLRLAEAQRRKGKLAEAEASVRAALKDARRGKDLLSATV